MPNLSYNHVSHVLQPSGGDYQWAHAHSWECWWDWCGYCVAYLEWWQCHTDKALLLRAGRPQGKDQGQKGQFFLLKTCSAILKHGVLAELDCKILVLTDLDCSSSTSRSCVLSVGSNHHQVVFFSKIGPKGISTKTSCVSWRLVQYPHLVPGSIWQRFVVALTSRSLGGWSYLILYSYVFFFCGSGTWYKISLIFFGIVGAYRMFSIIHYG